MIIDPGEGSEGGEGGEADVDLDIEDPGDGDDGDPDDDDGDPDDDDDLSEDEEAEYQAKMAKIREDQDHVKKKTGTTDKKGDGDKSVKEQDDSEKAEDGTKDQENKTKEEIHTVKINGVEKQLNTKELIAIAQKSESSEERFQQGATLRKQAEGLVKQLHADPMKVLEKLNVDPEKIEQWLYDTHIAPKILEGEEKEQWERNKEFERLKEKETSREEEDKTARQEQTRQAWSDKIVGAIKSSPGIPQTDWSVNRVAQYMQRAIKGGFRDVTPQEVLPYVQKDWNQIKSSQMDSLNEDEMLDYIGEAGTEKVRKALMKKHQAGQRKPRSQTRASASKKNKENFRRKNPRSPYDII
jgi:hypothetical protein